VEEKSSAALGTDTVCTAGSYETLEENLRPVAAETDLSQNMGCGRSACCFFKDLL